MCPRVARISDECFTAWLKSPAIAVMAERKRLPKLCPPTPSPAGKRYWKRRDSRASSPETATIQLRTSPGAGTFNSFRSRPLEPPSSLTVTMAERSSMRGSMAGSAVGARHLIGAVHGACGRLQRAPRRVFEGLPRRQHGLLADHPGTFDFFHMIRTIGDHPVPAEKLHGAGALVGNAHRVLENPFAFQRPRVFR